MRLERFRKYIAENPKYVQRLGRTQYPEHVKRIRGMVPGLEPLDDDELETLYSDFSTSAYAAGWLCEGYEERFAEWLRGEGEYANMYPNEWDASD